MRTKTEGLNKKAGSIRRAVLEMAVRAGSGHIASAFSCTEILVALYYSGILQIDPKRPGRRDRDRFILSKGHAAMALYAVLADLGFFPKGQLRKFCRDGAKLGAHPDHGTPGVDALSGSLGHGLAIGAGIALAAKLDGGSHRTFVLLGDGECQEGSVWEAAMFAAQHRLDNLVVIVDSNRLGATDLVKDCMGIEPLGKKWEAFGWAVEHADGHSTEDLLEVFRKIKARASSRPTAVIAATTKGKGVSFMENVPLWHYRVPAGEELKTARRELKGR